MSNQNKKNNNIKKSYNNSEQFYEDINKAFNAYISFAKIALYPATVILAFIIFWASWNGFDIKKSKNEIKEIQANLKIEGKKIKLFSEELQMKSKKNYEELENQFYKLTSKFNNINTEFTILKEKYNNALKKNKVLFKQLKSDNQSLSDFSNIIKKTVTQYDDEIKYAKKGIDQRKKDIQTILARRSDELKRIGNVIILLAEYLILVEDGRNKFPNPYFKRQLKLLNKMLFTLIPNAKVRNSIIKKLNTIIKPKIKK